MRSVVLVLVAIALSLEEHSRLAGWLVAPDLPLALAMAVMIDGPEEGALVRPWLVGLARDLIDPASQAPGAWPFAAIAYGLMGLAYLPIRHIIAPGIGWALWGTLLAWLMELIDRAISGGGDGGQLVLLASAVGTGLSCVAISWLMGGLPWYLSPVGRPPVTRRATVE